MSTFEKTYLECPSCKVGQTVVLPQSINIMVDPAFREQVLSGTFMRFSCPECGEITLVESELLYVDLDNGIYILVFPRYREDDADTLADLALKIFQKSIQESPGFVANNYGKIKPRLVFGYDQLREKIICADYGLDDHVIEAVKHSILNIPGSSEAGVTGLLLVSVGEEKELYFAQFGELFDPEDRELIQVKREIYDNMTEGGMTRLLKHNSLLGTPYVNRNRLVNEGVV